MRIAIVRLSAMGDIIQSMIVLQLIKEHIPDVKIDWFVDEKFSDVLKHARYLDNIFPLQIKGVRFFEFPYKIIALYKNLRNKGKYDLVIDLQGLIKSALVSKFILSEKRFGFDRLSIREPLASFFYSDTINCSYNKNVIIRYISLVNFSLSINVRPENILPKKPFFYLDKILNSEKPKIILILGASFESKKYSVKNYSQITNSIDADFYALFKSKAEKLLAKELSLKSNNVKILGNLNLDQLKEEISSSSLVIGGDTGPTHLAWALNIPSITIFGSTPIKRNFFETDINLGISSNAKVNPLKINKFNSSINDIHPSKIIILIEKLLNK